MLASIRTLRASYHFEEDAYSKLQSILKLRENQWRVLEAINKRGLEWEEDEVRLLAKQVLFALNEAPSDILTRTRNTFCTAHILVYCLFFLHNPASFTLEHLQSEAFLQSMMDKDGSAFLWTAVINQTYISQWAALEALLVLHKYSLSLSLSFPPIHLTLQL